jgi:hypothetical protein
VGEKINNMNVKKISYIQKVMAKVNMVFDHVGRKWFICDKYTIIIEQTHN